MNIFERLWTRVSACKTCHFLFLKYVDKTRRDGSSVFLHELYVILSRVTAWDLKSKWTVRLNLKLEHLKSVCGPCYKFFQHRQTVSLDVWWNVNNWNSCLKYKALFILEIFFALLFFFNPPWFTSHRIKILNVFNVWF